jgi:peptide/nickel transport system permease protein
MRNLLKSKIAVIGIIILALEILSVVLLPPILGLDPYSSVSGKFAAAPEAGHIFGFDELGRDVLSRVFFGGRVSLLVAFFSTLISLTIGVPLGLLAGYYGGFIETLVMRFSDIFMAFPAMILILILAAVIGQSVPSLILIMGVLSWTGFARLLHGRILSLREEEYIEAARAVGTRDITILLKYVLPNAIAPVLVQSAFAFSASMAMEAGLSFLGVGVQPPTPSWGNILFGAQSLSVLAYKPWMWLPAALFFLITVFCINFVGDGLRKALDPRAGGAK